MKTERKNKNKHQNGITLIGLVVTIIVLLILAGVSIVLLTGDNGILIQAQNAKKKTEKASIKEQRKLLQLEANLNMTETEYNGVTIPAYCAPTKIEGESTVDEGLVIIDKNGNEWVWIEVPKSIYTNPSYNGGTAPTGPDDYGKIEIVMKAYANDYRNSSCTDTWYSEAAHGFANSDSYNTYKNNMLKSVYDNGGFYIGRYEVGTQVTRFAGTNNTGLNTPTIQQDVYPYNYVTCKQAQSLSNQLAIGGKTSSLLFGIQWDLVMKFIEEKGKLIDGTKITQSMLKSNSSTWGNYNNITFDITKGEYTTYNSSISTLNPWTSVKSSYTKPASSVLLTTGATDRNRTLNIYDLAGNVWEWTLEQYTEDPYNRCSIRGGNYDKYGYYNPAAKSNCYNSGIADSVTGFRAVLY